MLRVWRAAVLLLLWTASAVQADNPALVVAVAPQFEPVHVYRHWTPVLTRLEQATGLTLELRVYSKVENFEAELLQGIPDFAYMNPYHMVLARQAQGYRPLVRDSAQALEGILVVRADGPIRQLSDLQGKAVAFPAPNALGASLYLRALLAEKEKIRIKPVYVGSHQTVYRQVLVDEAMAGGGVRATLNKESDAVQSQLRVLYTTPRLAPHPLAAHPRVPAAISRKLTQALLALQGDTEGRKLLDAIQLTRPVEAHFERDYQPLLDLKLERYASRSGQ